jgi:precorrin-3B C17-methyltransferase
MKLYAVGLGPGDLDYLAPGAKEAILACEVIVGYTGYIELIADLIAGKYIISTGMKGEVERCEAAIGEALKGKSVCVVSSGDAGIYGMAGLLFELAGKHPEVEVTVIPGITAASTAAAILGSPLTNDFAAVSLSDLLTPWAVIEKRLDAASAADFVLCLYNPQSKKRNDYLEKACAIALRHKPPGTVCGYVRNAYRGAGQESRVCALAELSGARADMFTTVIIGNAHTRVVNGKMVTARGYAIE